MSELTQQYADQLIHAVEVPMDDPFARQLLALAVAEKECQINHFFGCPTYSMETGREHGSNGAFGRSKETT
ncbi:hypothetical protein [Neorhizobium sp. T7_12]|uniref:hypothetical protein n=1 Tax=Neorhizobium sp. T7_12 TaxID=2093832 RepID=UPI00155E8246|nr:hypothetical protein [Neorhizobium sp. T7_12]